MAQQTEGKILSSAGEMELQNVRVLNQETGEEAFTSASGYFRIGFEKLPFRLLLSLPGYENKIVTVTNTARLLLYLDPSLESLGEVVIRGTHIPSQLRKIPAAISVISKNDLERIDATNFAQVFNNIPGVYVNQGALNTTKLNIRGIGGRSQYSTNRIQAYFNGFPLTTAEGELTLDDIDPESISRVEVIKGPASSIYGAGLGGVINIFSEEGIPGETTASVKTLFGSYNMTRKLFNVSHATENSSVFVNYSDLQSDGYRENGEYDRKSFLANASIETSEGNTLSFLANFTRLKAYIPSSVNEETFINSPESAAFTWAQSRGYESYDQGNIGVSYLHSFSSNFSNTTSLYLNFRDAYEPRPFDILKEERVSAGARTRFNLNTSLFDLSSRISFGAEYYNEWYETGTFENLYRQFEDIGSVAGLRFSNNEQSRNYSNLFAQMEIDISDRLKIEAGANLNITQYSLTDLFAQNEIDQSGEYQFNTIFSPRVGATYEISERKNLYASISHGFSIPTVAETLTPDGRINTALLPESGINYEAGFKGNWLNNKLYTEFAVYSIQIKDLLVAQRVAEDQYVGLNAGETSHNGLEMLVNYSASVGPGIRIKPFLNASFNFFEFKEFNNRDKDFAGNKLPGIPASTVNIGLDTGYRNFSLFTNLLAVGEIPLNDSNSLFTNSYEVLNIKATYDLKLAKSFNVILTAGINNVLDEKYAASVLTNAIGFGGAAPRYYYPGNPRNFYGGVGLNYHL
ncbi:MAG TPA: TonB-dependent receptor [Gillisia sp.]|nr:TonB-dependent receptor [Gillisia sp.]